MDYSDDGGRMIEDNRADDQDVYGLGPIEEPDYAGEWTERERLLAKLIQLDGILVNAPGGLTVESSTLIGYNKDNGAAVLRLVALINDNPNGLHAGIYNNLGCARAWQSDYEDALEALQQALDAKLDHESGGRKAKNIAHENAAIVRRVQKIIS